jgi:hypothetical protein
MSITIREVRPDSTHAVQLIEELDAYLMAHPYPAESRHAFSVDKLVREGVPKLTFTLLVRLGLLAAVIWLQRGRMSRSWPPSSER